MQMRRQGFLAILVLCVVAVSIQAQELPFPDVGTDPAVVAREVPDLAKEVLTSYKDPDREKYLDHLFRLQIVAGQYDKGIQTIGSLRELLRQSIPPRGVWVNAQYEIYAQAKLLESNEKLNFDDA